MSRGRSRSFVLGVTALAGLIGLGACGSDAAKTSSTAGAALTTTPPTSASATTAVSSTVVDTTELESTDPTTSAVSVPTSDSVSTEPATSESANTEAANTLPATTVPDALSQLPGVAALEVTVAGADRSRPAFTWAAAPGAASYQLAVQSADGVPVWAWSGDETSVVLGGAERAADVEGPTLTGPSRVRVYAFDAAFTVVAVSSWVALPGA